MSTFTKLASTFVLFLATFGFSNVIGCSADENVGHEDEHVGVADQALTAEQCNYFAVDGKVQICHRTASQTKPYTVLKISESACVSAHALHAGDYVAVNDPNCQGAGCLPAGAPCDPTLPCCDGFSCVGGTCAPNVSDHCNPSPCQNGGSCVSDSSGYTCDCPAGYTGTNCETEIDECASAPCVHGQCLDGINSYVCECEPGFTGTICDTQLPNAIESFSLAAEDLLVDRVKYGVDNAAVGPDGSNDSVANLVVTGNVKAIVVEFVKADGTCFPGVWDTVIGESTFTSCTGDTATGKFTFGLGVSIDGGATLVNSATGELPSLGFGSRTYKLYLPTPNAAQPVRARVIFQDGSVLLSNIIVSGNCNIKGCPNSSFCSAGTCQSDGSCTYASAHEGEACSPWMEVCHNGACVYGY